MTLLVLSASFALTYAVLAPSVFSQDWDSLMYSYWSEVKGLESIWGNHPLSHVLLNGVYALLTYLGYQGRALPIFIICNSIMGGAAVGIAYAVMRLAKVGYLPSVGSAIALGVTYGMWHYSGSADVYSLSVLLLLASWMSLIYEVLARRSRYLHVSGLLAGLSVLSHQLNGTFLVAASIALLLQKQNRRTRIVSYYGAAIAVTLLGTIVMGYLATSSWSPSVLYGWVRGYLGDPEYGTNLGLESVRVAGRSALGTILVRVYGRARFVRLAIFAIHAGIVAVGILHARLLDLGRKAVLLAATAQSVANAVLIAWFEPWYPKFWLLTFAPGLVILACSLYAIESGSGKRFWRLFAPLSLMSTCPTNALRLRWKRGSGTPSEATC